MNRLFTCCKNFEKDNEKMSTADVDVDSSASGLGTTVSVKRPSPAQSSTDVNRYVQDLGKDPTVLRSANSIGRLFKGGSKNNVTTIFAKNLVESATEDLQIELESCSSMSSGSCESGMDMMDSVFNITGLIHAEKNRIKAEHSKENLGLLSQITKFKPTLRATTETTQKESTHELMHRRDSKGETLEHINKGFELTTLTDLREGKIKTASGKTLRIRCAKTNEILRQKFIYNAKQELFPPKKKKFKAVAKAVAWTIRNRLAFLKGGDADKAKREAEEARQKKLCKIFVSNVLKKAVERVQLEDKKEAIRQERHRRAMRRKLSKTPNFFGEVEDFPDPGWWVQKYDKDHNRNNKALTFWAREIHRQMKEHELGPTPAGLALPCSNLSLRHSRHGDQHMAPHGDGGEEPTVFSGQRRRSSVHFGDAKKFGVFVAAPEISEEDKLDIDAGGATEQHADTCPNAKATGKPSGKTDSSQIKKESADKPGYQGEKRGGSSAVRKTKEDGVTDFFPGSNDATGSTCPEIGKGSGSLKDDHSVKSPVQQDQGKGTSPETSGPSSLLSEDSRMSDEPMPIWTKAPKERKSWTSQDKPRDMTDPRVDAPFILRSLTEVRPDKSAGETEGPPPAPRSSECLIEATKYLTSSSGSTGGSPASERADARSAPGRSSRGAAGTGKTSAGVGTSDRHPGKKDTASRKADKGSKRSEGKDERVDKSSVTLSMVRGAGLSVEPYEADDRVRNAVQQLTAAVVRKLIERNPYLLMINRAVSIVDPVMQAAEAEILKPILLGELIHQVNHTYHTMEAATLGLTHFFIAILSGMLTRVAGLMPLMGATPENGLPILPSNAPDLRTDTATSTANRLMAIRVSPQPSTSISTDGMGTDTQTHSGVQGPVRTKLSKGRYSVREKSPEIKNVVPSTPKKQSIPLKERDPAKPHTSARKGKDDRVVNRKDDRNESEKTCPFKDGKTEKPHCQEETKSECAKDRKTGQPQDNAEDKGTVWKVPDCKRRSSLHPEVLKDLKSSVKQREEKKSALHFSSQSSAVSQKSTVTRYGKGKKKDTTSHETSQAQTKTALTYIPPPPPPPLPGFLPGGSSPAQAASIMYTTQTAEVGQRVAVSSRDEDGTETATETSTLATMAAAEFTAPPAPPPLPPPDYYLSDTDGSDDETLKEQVPREVARVFVPPKYLDRFQSHGLKHVEFQPSPRSSAASSLAGSDVDSVRSSRASSPASSPLSSRSSSPAGRNDALKNRNECQSVVLANALRDATEKREAAHGGALVTSPGENSFSFRLQSQATKLKHSTTVRRTTPTGMTEDTTEASHMVATMQAGHIPSPPPLPAISLGLPVAHVQTGLIGLPATPTSFGQALHDAVERRDHHAELGHMQPSSPRNNSFSFRLQSQATKLKHSTTVKRKTPEGMTEDTAEASHMVATVQAGQIPSPPPLPSVGLGLQAQMHTGQTGPPTVLASPPPLPSMDLLSHHHAAPEPPPLPQLFGGLGTLARGGMSGGTVMRHTSASSKVTHKTTVKKGDETVENVAEASQAMATTEASHIPDPPPLPPAGLLGFPGIPDAPPPPDMGLLLAGSSGPVIPQPPPLPTLFPVSHGHFGATAFRATTASTKVAHKTKVTKGDETVENVSEAGQTVATMEASHIPEPPPLPSMSLLGLQSVPQAPPLPNMALLLAGSSGPVIPQPPPLPTSLLAGHVGGTTMRSMTASNKVTHKTKITKGDETVENVSEAGHTVATVEASHIPEPPPLPSTELLMHGSGFGRIPTPPALPSTELLMSGISGFGRENPQTGPPMALPSLGYHGGTGHPREHPCPFSIPRPPPLPTKGTAMRYTSVSSKAAHIATVTKGDETVEHATEAGHTTAVLQAGHIPDPPPLPPPGLMAPGAGFGPVPGPPALPPMELLMSGISDGFARVPSPPALPPMDLLMSGISDGFGTIPTPPSLPPMELLMSGITGIPERDVSGASPPPLLGHIGCGTSRSLPDPQQQATVMYAARETNLSQRKTVTRRQEDTEHSTTEEFQVGTKTAALCTNIPDPPPMPALEYFGLCMGAPHVHHVDTFRHTITQQAGRFSKRRERAVDLHLIRKESSDLLLYIEENSSKFSPEELEEAKKEARLIIADIDARASQLGPSRESLLENLEPPSRDESLETTGGESTDDFDTAPESIQSHSEMSIHVGRPSPADSQRTEQPQGVQSSPEAKTPQPSRTSAVRSKIPVKISATPTAGPSKAQAQKSAVPNTSKKTGPEGLKSYPRTKYTPDEKAKTNEEVDRYWKRRFSKDREKPWWNISDKEERERARRLAEEGSSEENFKKAGSKLKGAPYSTPGSSKAVCPEKFTHLKYEFVDRGARHLPGQFGASTDVRPKANQPDTGLVPKKFDLEYFDNPDCFDDSTNESDFEIDLDKPMSKENLHDDAYWKTVENKTYATLQSSMVLVTDTSEDSAQDEQKSPKPSPSHKKPSRIPVLQARKEKEMKRDKETREKETKEKWKKKKEDKINRKVDTPKAKPSIGPQPSEKKKKGLTRFGHKKVSTQKPDGAQGAEPSTSKQPSGRRTPTKLVGKIKGGFKRVKDSIRSRLSGEDSDSSFDSNVE